MSKKMRALAAARLRKGKGKGKGDKKEDEKKDEEDDKKKPFVPFWAKKK